MNFNPFLNDDPVVPLNSDTFQSAIPSEDQPKEPFLDYLSTTGLLDSSSDLSSADNSFLNTDLLDTLDTKDTGYDHPLIDDLFPLDLQETDTMVTFLSPLALSIHSNKSSVDPEAVCMGQFPSFGISEPISKDFSNELPKKDTSIELPSTVWETETEKEHQGTEMEVESENPDVMVPTVIPDLFPIQMNSPSSCYDDSDGNEDYLMEVEAERDYYEKKNHTWEETATQLQLPISTTEMSHYVIPDHWLTADEYQQLLCDMERGNGTYPLYELGIDNHQVTYHPNFIYMNPCPAIYFLRCEFLKNGRPMFGFPRVKNVSKQYTWKKQGFTTAIPKSNPTVRYITANCYLCGKGKNRVTEKY